jgi:acyl-CoA hydrolase
MQQNHQTHELQVEAFTPMLGEKRFFSIARKIVMNGDLNGGGRLFGGKALSWVDENAALFCMSQLGTRHIVTKKISEVIFNEPAELGDILEFLCRVREVGRTSITIECIAVTKKIDPKDTVRIIVQCDLVFVALNDKGRPAPHGFNMDKLNSPKFEF